MQLKIQSTESPSLEMVPPEILEKIFECLAYCDLNSAALVCRSWRSVAQTPRFWKNIQIEVTAKDFEEVVKIPRLAQIENLVLNTGDTVKTKITFNFDTVIKMHVF